LNPPWLVQALVVSVTLLARSAPSADLLRQRHLAEQAVDRA
jgi:hypothetical protein